MVKTTIICDKCGSEDVQTLRTEKKNADVATVLDCDSLRSWAVEKTTTRLWNANATNVATFLKKTWEHTIIVLIPGKFSRTKLSKELFTINVNSSLSTEVK